MGLGVKVMNTSIVQNIDKYQGAAPKQVISAVASAARRTGADFAFLMEKASTESSFNPAAKSKSSSATGLFQFIEQTWLNMVKKYGDKYGLSEYADRIEIKGGKACCDDADVKNKILALRKNPEISALMAGEFSAENKKFLEPRIRDAVGPTELYLAHFMGAGGAAKFLNSKEYNPDAVAATLFPNAAKANKNIFFDKTTGQPRTLGEIYQLFDDKFNGGVEKPSKTANPSASSSAVSDSARAPAAVTPLTLETMARALPSFDDENETDDIIWNDDPRFKIMAETVRSGFGGQKLSPVSIYLLSDIRREMMPESRRYNS
jgi:hypothetical protein